MAKAKMHPDAKRLRNIVVSFPIFVVTSVILYRRVFLGEEQRKFPKPDSEEAKARIALLSGPGGASELPRRSTKSERKILEDSSETRPS